MPFCTCESFVQNAEKYFTVFVLRENTDHKWKCNISAFSHPSQLSHLNSFSKGIGPSKPHMFRAFCIRFQGQSLLRCHKSAVMKTLPAAPVDTFYSTLIISFLAILPMSLYINRACGSNAGSLRSFFASTSLGRVGWHYHSIKQLQKWKAMQYALQIAENNQTFKSE